MYSPLIILTVFSEEAHSIGLNTTVVIQSLILLLAVVATWVGLNNKVTRTETRLQDKHESDKEERILRMDSIKNEFDLQVEGIKNEFMLRISQIERETELRINQIKSHTEGEQKFFYRRLDELKEENTSDHTELKNSIKEILSKIDKIR